ncbi:MAG: 50S ribosomal protein L19 [Microgenomates group bacterium GW2011_GWF2_45_18]|nr:MAG: 50S ribosomal protein L19 [Microgenomates group bacterium GW2011_GWF1_44_10]KKU01550.1 MAG: 50S ribosomal protein L19 [Microgenomates group bacterium GW2011_GWF2_45_18]OGJ41624.1 MAG: 50S ribosomal protein L19 [Candidatus Pacebacteria bacterium RIFOXYB1_FULL_44_10]HAU99459.1 50S ribosomal protein L19 [Candidatus Paceibacterota bacterium]HAX01535.1 50S ribosomal protein L19 [Candidatus Paceibacterota bacterium]
MAKYLNVAGTEASVGDTILVYTQINEGEKTRLQIFEGILIAVNNRKENTSFVVRKIATDSIGVERIFPVDSPTVAKIEVKRKGKVKRAKLSYLRGKVGKMATKVKQEVSNTAK